jgi:hypothetical protein
MRGLVRRTWTGAPWLESLAAGPLDLTKLPTMRRQKGKRREAAARPDLSRVLGYSADPAPGPGGPGDGGADSDAAGSDEDDGVVGGGGGRAACWLPRRRLLPAPPACTTTWCLSGMTAVPLWAGLAAGGARVHQDARRQDGGAPPRAEDARRVAGQAGAAQRGGGWWRS